jgi:hypothetical protein
MVNNLVHDQDLQKRVGSEALPKHKSIEFGRQNLLEGGKRVCLQKLEPILLRPIERFNVVAKLSVTVNEFPLRYGQYDSMRVAWGKGTMLSNDMMVVATSDKDGQGNVTLSSTSPLTRKRAKGSGLKKRHKK